MSNSKIEISEIEKWVEWLLLESSFSVKTRDSRYSESSRNVKFKWFNPAILMGSKSDWLTGDDYNFFLDATPSALCSPLDCAIANESRAIDGSPVNPCKEFAITHVRVATHEEWRGKPFYPERYCLISYYFYPQTSRWFASKLFVSKTNGHYRIVSKFGENTTMKNGIGMLRDDEPPCKELDDAIRCALGMQFTSEFFWHADIGWDGHPFVRLPLTAERAYKLFSLRDTPTANQRRTALLHWITAHTRILNKGEANEKMVKVVPNIRGVYDFGWNGLNVKVYPSASLIRELNRRQGDRITKNAILHSERVDESLVASR